MRSHEEISTGARDPGGAGVLVRQGRAGHTLHRQDVTTLRTPAWHHSR